jgi:type I restriction enzyme S subunit
MDTINEPILIGMAIPTPSLKEQRAIADYLDAETARVDALIEKKRRMVELLEERRTLKISEMLDCTVMDKSIHPWPARRVPLRHLASVHGGLTLGKQYDSAVVSRPYIRVANVQDGHLDLSDIAQIDVPPEVARRHELHHGDLLLLEGNGNPANLGRGTLWRGELQRCLHQNHVHVVRVDPNLLLPEYLDLVVRSQWARFFFTGESDAVGISTLSQDRIRELPVPVPSIEQQRLLVEAAASQGRKHERAARLLLDQISLLAERRQALITAAVTGELAIPGVAA